MSAEGAKIEAPQAPRWVGAGGGVPLPLREGSGEGAVLPPQKIFGRDSTVFKFQLTTLKSF